jgi:hypothetical protein
MDDGTGDAVRMLICPASLGQEAHLFADRQDPNTLGLRSPDRALPQ